MRCVPHARDGVHHRRSLHHAKRPDLSDRQIRSLCWPARRDSNPRPLESESTAISSFATGGWCAQFMSRLYFTPFHVALQEEICILGKIWITPLSPTVAPAPKCRPGGFRRLGRWRTPPLPILADPPPPEIPGAIPPAGSPRRPGRHR